MTDDEHGNHRAEPELPKLKTMDDVRKWMDKHATSAAKIETPVLVEKPSHDTFGEPVGVDTKTYPLGWIGPAAPPDDVTENEASDDG